MAVRDEPGQFVVTVAGDAGGAAAVAPVIQALNTEGRYRVLSLAYREARGVFGERLIPFEELDETTTIAGAERFLGELRPLLVLLGTSGNSVNLEKTFIAAARLVGVPSLAILDYWLNYRKRFDDDNGRISYLPDVIAVMDERARSEMIDEGFPGEVLVVTGHPGYDCLDQVRRRTTSDVRETIRAGFGIKSNEIMILFASEPISQDFGDNTAGPTYAGYTEKTVLNSVIETVERIAKHTDLNIALLVRPHPRDNISDLSIRRPHGIKFIVSRAGAGHEVAMAADLVIGMQTQLLVEACLLGCPVISYQPGIRFDDPLPTNRMGLSRAVYEESEIESVIRTLLCRNRSGEAAGESRLCGDLLPGNATQSVIGLIDSMVRGTGA
jgi:hypothetical protein